MTIFLNMFLRLKISHLFDLLIIELTNLLNKITI